MMRLNLLLCGVVLFGSSALQASIFRLDVDNGEVVIFQKTSQISRIAKDSASVAPGDSLILSDGQLAQIQLESYSRLLCKGPLSLVLSGDDISLKIGMSGEGQMFLERNKPYALGSIEISAEGYTFRPIGTSAAVKTTEMGTPSTAVLKGKMNMKAPNGDVIVVEQGNFGAVNLSGKLVSEKLSKQAIESLQQWVDSSKKKPATANELTPVSQTEDKKGSSEEKLSGSTPVASGSTSSPEEISSSNKPMGDNQVEKKKDEKGDNATDEDGNANDDTPAPKWEIGAGVVTVDNEQWTRIAVGVDVPIWKFGVFFELELFVDNNGNISDKGWNFKDEPLEAATRKIRYIRFGQEQDPLFIKFGGLSSVTLGYGFLVDRFTNMLHYPGQKLLGLQFYLNDLTPIGLTLQTVLADFKDFNDDGGVLGVRLALTPLKATQIPIIKGISLGATYATDLNQYAPARGWDYTLRGPLTDRDEDGIIDGGYVEELWHSASDTLTPIQRDALIKAQKYDTLVEHKDKWASLENEDFGLIGGDVGIPLIRSSLVNLDLYGQAGLRDDGIHGWGIGAPGVALKVWQIWANVEYRRIEGRFAPGYFGTYYLEERIIRNYADESVPSGARISVKEDRLPDDVLNGVFGKLGFNIADVLTIDGSYQYMVGQNKDNTDKRLEAVASFGDLLIQRIPKISKVEGYFLKSEIGNYIIKTDINNVVTYDSFFDKTPFMYFGYRLGFKISEGATLIWDSRYGFKTDKNGKLKENNFISVQTAITF